MNIPGYDAWKLRGPDEVADPEMEACEACKGEGSDTEVLLPATNVEILAGKHEATQILLCTQSAFWLHGRDNGTALFLLKQVHAEFAAMAEALGYAITRKPITCEECNGAGELPVTPEEPDGDYAYERARDARWEVGA